MNSFKLIILVTVVSLVLGLQEQTPVLEYLVTTEKRTWNEAKQICQSWKGSGYLVSIKSQTQNQHLVNLLHQYPNDAYWIGLSIECGNYNKCAGPWKYTDKTNLQYKSWEVEPLERYRVQDCVKLVSSSGRWRISSCEDKAYFICERVAKNEQTFAFQFEDIELVVYIGTLFMLVLLVAALLIKCYCWEPKNNQVHVEIQQTPDPVLEFADDQQKVVQVTERVDTETERVLMPKVMLASIPELKSLENTPAAKQKLTSELTTPELIPTESPHSQIPTQDLEVVHEHSQEKEATFGKTNNVTNAPVEIEEMKEISITDLQQNHQQTEIAHTETILPPISCQIKTFLESPVKSELPNEDEAAQANFEDPQIDEFIKSERECGIDFSPRKEVQLNEKPEEKVEEKSFHLPDIL